MDKKSKFGGSQNSTQDRVLSNAFRAAGMQLTRQRLEIYRELLSRCDHPDVELLYDAVKPRLPQISLFTVYRTMNALETAGLAWRVATWRGRARYDGIVDTHTHFMCETCGRIDNVSGESEPVPAFPGLKGTVKRAEVFLTGNCESCSAGFRQPAQPRSF